MRNVLMSCTSHHGVRADASDSRRTKRCLCRNEKSARCSAS
jgi:hypothetical protein